MFALSLGYVQSSFDLVWVRAVNNGDEEMLLDMHSTATLYELDMPEEPHHTRLLLKESQTGPPEKVKVCTPLCTLSPWYLTIFGEFIKHTGI